MVTHTLYSPPGFGVSLYGISCTEPWRRDRKSTRLNSSHGYISYAVFCLKKKTRRLFGPNRDALHRRRDSASAALYRVRRRRALVSDLQPSLPPQGDRVIVTVRPEGRPTP